LEVASGIKGVGRRKKRRLLSPKRLKRRNLLSFSLRRGGSFLKVCRFLELQYHNASSRSEIRPPVKVHLGRAAYHLLSVVGRGKTLKSLLHGRCEDLLIPWAREGKVALDSVSKRKKLHQKVQEITTILTSSQRTRIGRSRIESLYFREIKNGDTPGHTLGEGSEVLGESQRRKRGSLRPNTPRPFLVKGRST